MYKEYFILKENSLAKLFIAEKCFIYFFLLFSHTKQNASRLQIGYKDPQNLLIWSDIYWLLNKSILFYFQIYENECFNMTKINVQVSI